MQMHLKLRTARQPVIHEARSVCPFPARRRTLWRQILIQNNNSVKLIISVMDEFPNSEDEFDLMYGDELELLREQEGKSAFS
jgi:hypothetical protein